VTERSDRQGGFFIGFFSLVRKSGPG
jgi:hypothetical protein